MTTADAMRIPRDRGVPTHTEPATPRNEQEARDLKEIDALWDLITTSYRNRDPLGAMAGLLNSDEFMEFDVVMPFTDPGYDRNMEKTRAWMDQSQGPTEVTYFDRKIHLVAPDAAFGIAFVRFNGTTLSGDNIDVTCRHTRLVRKIDGRWICTMEHTSQPHGWSVDL